MRDWIYFMINNISNNDIRLRASYLLFYQTKLALNLWYVWNNLTGGIIYPCQLWQTQEEWLTATMVRNEYVNWFIISFYDQDYILKQVLYSIAQNLNSGFNNWPVPNLQLCIYFICKTKQYNCVPVSVRIQMETH